LKNAQPLSALLSLFVLAKKANAGLTDSHKLETQSSTKDNYLDGFDSKVLHQAETALSTPRYDLELEVVESDYLEASKRFRIKSTGLVNGAKVFNQGSVYIGTETMNNQEGEGQNDIICQKYKNAGSVHTARLELEGPNFQIKELGGGDGVYIKAEDKMPLDHQSIVHYGIGHFVVELVAGKEKKKPLLKLKFMDGTNEGLEKIIEPEQTCTFGRLSTCTVVFDEYGVSRIQCKIFCEDGQWYLKDGDGFKKSTNGTWILLQDKKIMFNKMIFKVCNTVFKTHMVDSA